MSKVTDTLELKQKIERMKQDRDKAQGAFEQIMGQIQTEFGCKSLEEVEKKLHIMQRKSKQDKEKILKEQERLEKEIGKHES
jgi:hypothetical protein